MPLQYDQDVVTWSPQGRIHQIEYAMEAVKQGSAVVGLKVRGLVIAVPIEIVRQHEADTAMYATPEQHARGAGIREEDLCRAWQVPAKAFQD